MNTVKISVIIPVYNAEKYLDKCINSVLNQTLRDIEIICVDDGSKDSSFEILDKISKKDKRVKLFSIENNGVSNARNFALDLAKGEYILFLDSDDWVSADICEKLYSSITSNNYDVVMCAYTKEFKNKSVENALFHEVKTFSKDEVFNQLYRRMIGIVDDELRSPERADNLCTIWAKLYRTSIINDNNIRFIDLKKIGSYEDGLFNLEYFRQVNNALYLPNYLYHYRKDNMNSITTVYNPNLIVRHEEIHKYLENHIEKYDLNENFKNGLSNRIALELPGYCLNILRDNSSYFDKIKRIKNILIDKKYKQAFKKLDFGRLPIHWKIYYLCARFNFSTTVYLLTRIIRFIIGRED